MKRMMVSILIASALLASVCLAGEIGFEEDFALAKDRTVPLKQLIPGTEDYYFYHCLHYQNTGELDKVDGMLKLWIERHGRTGRIVEIENRQALLRYDKDPAGSLAYLQRKLSLTFNHEKELLDQKPQLPTVLDQNLIGRDPLARRAFANHPRTLDGFEPSALEWLIKQQLTEDQRRSLLQRLARPDYSDLSRLVVDDLNYRLSSGFGSLPIHRQLLLSQLDECVRLKPELQSETNFVGAYMIKLQPDADVDWRHDAKERQAYFDRLWAFVSKLTPVHNSLKAHVLYHRLVHDLALGVYDKDRFLEYLKLPRNVVYVNRDYLARRELRDFVADLNASYQGQTLLPPISLDEPLVRNFLAHFFLTEDTYEPYKTYVNDVYLKNLFAETKILAGQGDMEKWYSMLSPADYQALKDRVDIDFVPTNKQVFAPDEPVALDVYVKNVGNLIVKVFEINAMNYYRDNKREVDTDINLDGLVANEETVHPYKEVALRRVLTHFDFASLKKRGVYVVEFIGGGKSSRALIRKGRLHHLVRTSTAGHVFTVLDDANRKLPNATLWLSGREYKADKDGVITVPFTNSPQTESVILTDGDFVSLDKFDHLAENYSLQAGIYADRETLLKRKQAAVVVRPALYLNGAPVTLSVLENPSLVIVSTDREGVSTSKEVTDFPLFEDRESGYDFQVPEDLAHLTFILKAKVQNLSQNKKVDLSVQSSFSLNGIDATEKVEDLHLRHAAGQYFLDVLGKTGEARPDRPIPLVLKHRDFKDTVDASIQTGPNGTVPLGALKDIQWVRATGPEGTQHTWFLLKDLAGYPGRLDGRVGDALYLPYMGDEKEVRRDKLSLLEKRGDTFSADRFDALLVKDGFLVIQGLARGDYALRIKDMDRDVLVSIAPGDPREGYVLGENRYLEAVNPKPLQIESVLADKDNLKITIKNATKFARVHLVATRYMPEYSMPGELGKIGFAEPSVAWLEKIESLYVAGRNIGDEFRYILERKYAAKYPGNMLERPHLLLNPWAIRQTETGLQEAEAGEPVERALGGRLSRGLAGKARDGFAHGPSGIGPVSADLDFLSEQAVVLVNLRPDDAGVVTVKRKDLGAHQQIHVLAVDPQNTVYREVALDDVPTQFLDLRLSAGLDPQKHFTEQKEITVVKAKDKFVLQDVNTSKMETYDTLGKVYKLYVTLSSDPTLVEFDWILNWPAMKPEEKREKYSKYACHELNFFLMKKDPAFFETVVQPYLRNKKDKTFLDHYLIGSDLSGYLKPWNYQQLNIVERVLLSERVQNERPQTARHVTDLYDLLPPDIERFNFLFKTALKGSALELPVAGGPVATSAPAKQYAPGAMPAPRMATETADEITQEWVTTGGRLGVVLADKDKATLTMTNGQAIFKAEAGYFADDKSRRQTARQFYRKLDTTQEWVENNYYHLPIETQNADLVKVNAFWRDFARHDGKSAFFSVSLAEASHNFTEMMFALSVLDVPFEAKKHATSQADAQFTLSAESPLVVFHKEIKEAQAAAEKTPILVSQNFFRASDRYAYVNNEQIDKYVTDEFLVHVVYGCQVVITNPTSSRQKLDILLQVPRGAMPVQNGFYTRGIHVDLDPYSTRTIEYFFYFPAAGKYPHYPLHVAKDEKLIAFSPAVTLNAVEKLTNVDRASWDYVSQFGTGAEVLGFLKTENLGRVNLDRIAWRMKDRDYFTTVVALLDQRHVYNDTLWSYGIKHDDLKTAREFLRHCDDFVAECGPAIDAKLLTIDPVVRKSYQFMEYSPLVNARAHRLGKKRTILNDRFFAQYEHLMGVLACRPALDDDDLMTVTYYLLLEDRVDEAVAFFARVAPANLRTQIQYDYFRAYLDFYTDDHRIARAVALKYEAYPVDRWRVVFANVLTQLDEIEGKAPKVTDKEDRTQLQTKLAASEPGFDFKVEEKKITVNYQNLAECRVNYYLMDIELLFSRNPFVQEYSGQFAFIRPNETAVVQLPAGLAKLTFPLPARFDSSNVMVEIEAAGVKKSRAYYSNALALQIIENYGQIRLTHEATGKPLSKVYVKVYARMKGGAVQFYKDGYTDLRGRFDYTSLSTNELDNVEKFSLLVLSDTDGAVVREADPPKR